jgi:hypothetical protein
MKKYWRNLSPDTQAGNAAQPEERNEDTEAQSEASATEAKAVPTDTNEMINNTGLDHPPANNDEDTDLSEGTHDADAATG